MFIEESSLKRGIKIINKNKLKKNTDSYCYKGMIFQEIIQNPLLWNGRKIDFRDYLIVSKTKPFQYILIEGFGRIANGKLIKSHWTKSSFLTNVSQQKKESLIFRKDIMMLFNNNNINQESIKQEKIFIIKNLLKQFSPTKNYFNVELFGLDFLITQNGKVYLLEVNSQPNIVIGSKEKNTIYEKVYSKYFEIIKDNINQLKSLLQLLQ